MLRLRRSGFLRNLRVVAINVAIAAIQAQVTFGGERSRPSRLVATPEGRSLIVASTKTNMQRRPVHSRAVFILRSGMTNETDKRRGLANRLIPGWVLVVLAGVVIGVYAYFILDF
jgi:uncharacterized membrane protein